MQTANDSTTVGGSQDGERHRRPILVPLDGSRLAEQALGHAVHAAQRYDAPLLLVRVVDLQPVLGSNLAADALASIYEVEREAEAQRYLEEQAAALRHAFPGLVVETELALGAPAFRVIEVEAARHAQLVVLTTHGRTGLDRWVRGSVAEHVLRHGAAPVLLVRPWDLPSAVDSLAGRAGIRVLVPLDGSPLAEQVLPAACRLASGKEGFERPSAKGTDAAGSRGELVLLCVCTGSSVQPAAVGVATHRDRAFAQRYLERVAAQVRQSGVRVRTIVLVAQDVAAAIVEQSVVEASDLVAMSTHGRGGIGRWLHGSVADCVAFTCRVPVLLFHPPATAPAVIHAALAGESTASARPLSPVH